MFLCALALHGVNSGKLQFMSAPTIPELRRGVFFFTDIGFALPTLASALEVRRKIPKNYADIRIVTTGIPDATLGRIADVIDGRGIFLDILEPSIISGFDHNAYNKTHVPVSALGRFFMLDVVPDIYDRILYLDGDTWPIGDPMQLLDGIIPARWPADPRLFRWAWHRWQSWVF